MTAPSPHSPLRAGARRAETAKHCILQRPQSFFVFPTYTMVQNLLRGVLLAAGLHCARGNAHEPTRAPTTTQAAAPTPRPTMTDRRGGKADEIPVRAAAFAAAGFAALGLIAAAVWRGDSVPRKTPETPRLRPWFGLKARGSARVWTPRLAQPRAPRGRLLPYMPPRPRDRHRHRHRTGTAPRPPRRPTPTNSRRTPRARPLLS